MSSSESPEGIINIEIISDTIKLVDIWVDEYHNCSIVHAGDELRERHYSRRQSERTLDLIISLREYDKCGLPTYNQSCIHHLLILEQLKNKFIDVGIDARVEIPIT